MDSLWKYFSAEFPSLEKSAFDQYLALVSNRGSGDRVEVHHILPRSLFPEFSDLRKHAWNAAPLDYDRHIEAHRMLWEMTGHPKMAIAYFFMSRQADAYGGSYASAREAHCAFLSTYMSENNPMSGRTGSLNPFFGKKHSPESIQRVFDTKGYVPKRQACDDLSVYYRRLEGVQGFFGSDRSAVCRAETSKRTTGKKWCVIDGERRRVDVVPEGAALGVGLDEATLKERNRKISEAASGVPRGYVADKVNRNPEKIRKTAEKHQGMKRSVEAKRNIAVAVSQTLYHTPHGVFVSESEFKAHTGYSGQMLRTRCINNVDKVLDLRSTCRMPDADAETKAFRVGKTWRELGWYTTPRTKDTRS